MKDKKNPNNKLPEAALNDEQLDNVAGGIVRQSPFHPNPPDRPDPIDDSAPLDTPKFF